MSTESVIPLRVALLGSGIFATNSHAPVLQKYPNIFTAQAVWSRRAESSEKLANTLKVQSYSGPDGLDELLKRDDIDAVILALPLDSQPQFVLKALASGKHVLSEKPIASAVQEAKKLVDEYRSQYSKYQWSIAENFRYEPAILRAADIVKNEIGKPFLVSLTIRAPFTPDNKYLNTSWRKNASWYGGLFMDAFVHASAMLRWVLGEPKTVSSIALSQADYIPSVDTMAAHVQWHNGAIGSVTVTYACQKMKFELEVTGTEGTMLLQRRTDGPGYRITKDGNEEEVFGFGGIEGEFLAFAKACQGREADRNSPEEALGDIALVEALLKSGQANGAIQQVKR